MKHRLRQAWELLKLVYLYHVYFLVGVDDQYFYISKGNCFAHLHWNRLAIRNYKKALKESKDPRIHFMLGVCYLRVKNYHNSVEHFRIAYEKLKDPKVAVGLAITEYETGNIAESERLINDLRDHENELDLKDKAALNKVIDLIIMAKQQNGLTTAST